MRRGWDKVVPFFAFPSHIRRVIYTTNAIENVNAIEARSATGKTV